MGHFQLGKEISDGLWIRVRGDGYGTRPRSDWTPNSGLGDGAPFGLLHCTLSTTGGRKRPYQLDFSVLNMLDTEHKYLIYIDDADSVRDGSPKYPYDIEGEGRTVYIGLTQNY